MIGLVGGGWGENAEVHVADRGKVRTCPGGTVEQRMGTVSASYDRFERLCSRRVDRLKRIERLGPVLHGNFKFVG